MVSTAKYLIPLLLFNKLASGHIAMVDIDGLPQINPWYASHLCHSQRSPAALAFKEFLVEQGVNFDEFMASKPA